MAVPDPTAELEQERRRELRRFMAYSAVGHVLLVLALAFVPEPRSTLTPQGVVSVRLVDAGALSGAPEPAPPKPEPEPKPPEPKPEPEPVPPEPEVKPKPKPPVEDVVLPEEPTEPEPEPPKPKPEPEPKPVQEQPEPEPEPEVEYDELLAELREERGEEQPPASEQTARAEGTAGVPGSPDGAPIDPEHAAWIRRAKLHVTRNWVLASGFRTQPLSARVTVRLDPQGRVLGAPRVTDSSGNPWYDESALRAIEKSDPLPPPPEPGEWSFVFRPEDLY